MIIFFLVKYQADIPLPERRKTTLKNKKII